MWRKKTDVLTEVAYIWDGECHLPADPEYLELGLKEGWLKYSGYIRDGTDRTVIHTYTLRAP